jgi:DNA-binding response OmpR family regulator
MSPELNFQVVPLDEVPLTEPAAHPNPPVVLIVDDERLIADTLSVILSNSGFAVMTAYDGQTALELASVVPPELLLTDVSMPGMNGVELAITLIQSVPDCKILLFSGQASTIDLLDRAHHAGHDFTLVLKPVHPTDLLARISKCLENQEAFVMQQPVRRRLELVRNCA